MLVRGGRGSYPMRQWRINPRGQENLPGRFGYAGDLAVEGEFAELDTGDAELADVGARAATHRAAVADAGGRRIARELLQLLLRGVERVVGGGGILQDRLELGARGGVLRGETFALFVALDGGCFRHDGENLRFLVYELRFGGGFRRWAFRKS